MDWTIPTPFIAGTYAFSIFSSDKGHSSFLDLPVAGTTQIEAEL
jgi:hypothetical protein